MDRYLGMHLSFAATERTPLWLGMGGGKAPAGGEKVSWLWPSRSETIRQ